MSTGVVVPFPVPDYERLNDVVQVNVLAELARRRMSQADFSAGLGLSQQAVSDRLRGRVKLTVDDLDQFAALLGVEPGDLLVRHQGLEPRTR